MATTHNPPDLRWTLVCTIIAWLSACLGLATALYTQEWLTAIWAVQAVILAAGWWMAVRQWWTWRGAAEVLAQRLAELEGA